MTCQGGKCLLCVPDSTQACYTGPPNTEGVGICAPGKATCAADGMSWEKCADETVPTNESCKNGLDDDCDGSVDSGSGCLVNTDLVVRYFLDEAASGAGVTAMDSAPNPLNLSVSYNSNEGQPNYVQEATGRGLEWTTADRNGVAEVAANNTKVQSMLNTKTKATFELVTRMDSTAGYNRTFGITNGMATVFTLLTVGTGAYAFNLNGGELGRWNGNYSAGRVVLHVVYDSTDGTAANRVRFYVNGMQQPSTGGNAPNQNAPIGVGPNDWLALGNRDSEGRCIDGVIYYAAMYANALSATDIANNFAILSANDDK